MRAATDALHAAGMEVILDVVLNHNGESDQFGPTLSFRGLDNAAFFRLDPRDPATYINDTGTGNCLALDRPLVIAMAIGALQALDDPWRLRRLPLRSRDHARPPRLTGFDRTRPSSRRSAADPILAQGALIAEPWDIGPGGYQLGHSPRLGRMERPLSATPPAASGAATRGMRGEIATRIAGSRDVFAGAPRRRPGASISSSPMTASRSRDLVSYEHKHNEANGEHNRDGIGRQLLVEPRRRGPERRPGDPRGARARRAQSADAAARLARNADAGDGHRSSASARAATTTPMRRTTRRPGSTGARPTPALIAFTGRLIGARRTNPALSPRRFPDRQPLRRQRSRPTSNGATPRAR